MSRQIVLRGGDRRVVLLRKTHVSGRNVDERVLAIDADAELGLITCVWDRTGQKAKQSIPERSCFPRFIFSSWRLSRRRKRLREQGLYIRGKIGMPVLHSAVVR